MENYESKNTVKAVNQVSGNVYLLGETLGSPKIIFLGNSITKHGKAPQIGWYGDWGMAASSADRDYVHLCMKGISERFPDASFMLVQGSDWEFSYKDCDLKEAFEGADTFNPDVIICCIGANIKTDEFEHNAFIESLRGLHSFLGGNNAKIIISSSYFNNENKNIAIKEYAEKFNAEYVYISDIILDEENRAGEFEHGGVRIHPGDKGMEILASRILEAFNKLEL